MINKDFKESLDEAARCLTIISRRRLEAVLYGRAIAELQDETPGRSKESLSYRRRLAQPDAYEILSIIWLDSPFAVGAETYTGYEIPMTAYRLDKELREWNPHQETKNAIPAVLKAAVYFGLVNRISVGKKMKPLLATPRLNKMLRTLIDYSTGIQGMTLSYKWPDFSTITDEQRAEYRRNHPRHDPRLIRQVRKEPGHPSRGEGGGEREA